MEQWLILDSLIREFEFLLKTEDENGEISVSRLNWKEIWGKASEILQAFKEVKYPSKLQHDEAWKKFKTLHDAASKLSKDEREQKKVTSETLMNEIFEMIKKGIPAEELAPEPANEEKMKEFGTLLNEAGKRLGECKQDMLTEHKQECFNEIQKVRELHDKWWAEVKKEKVKRREDYLNSVRENLKKNHERLEKANQAYDSCKKHVDELKEQIANSNNEAWILRATGWISELEVKIVDIEKSIERINGWIKEGEDKLK